MNFQITLPRQIILESGCINKISTVISANVSRITIICSRKFFNDDKIRNKINSLLNKYQIQWLKKPAGEPTPESVHTISAQIKKSDLFIAIGGGSVIDSAKAVSCLQTNGGKLEDYLEGVGTGKQIRKPCLPIIAVPTTAGTGTEATKNAVICDHEKGYKKSLRHYSLVPDTCLIDPELSQSLPFDIYVYAAIDALTQLIESYLSKKSNLFTEGIVEKALPQAILAIESISTNHNSLNRERMSYAALCSGIALANSGLGAVHGFASGIGGLYPIAHGKICATLLPEVLKTNLAKMNEDNNKIYKLASLILGKEFIQTELSKPKFHIVLNLIYEKIVKLIHSLKIPAKFDKISSTSIDLIIEKSLGSSMKGNPVELSKQEQKNILSTVFSP